MHAKDSPLERQESVSTGQVRTRVCWEEETRESFVIFLPLVLTRLGEDSTLPLSLFWFSQKTYPTESKSGQGRQGEKKLQRAMKKEEVKESKDKGRGQSEHRRRDTIREGSKENKAPINNTRQRRERDFFSSLD